MIFDKDIESFLSSILADKVSRALWEKAVKFVNYDSL
jgi:hypothetical protein